MMNLKKLHNNWRKAILLSACFVLAISVLPACKKKTSLIGTEALNVEDLLAAGGKDTFQLKTYSIEEDSIPTGNQPYGTLGICNDPKLGVINTSIYTQMSIEGAINLSGATLISIDSVVLGLCYGGSYGKLTPQTFEVYELTEKISIDSTYYRNSTRSTNGINLVEPSSATQTPNLTSKVPIDNLQMGGKDTLNPQLRLHLNHSIGQQFVQDAIAGNSAFSSTAEFLNSGYFKGLKINVSSTVPPSGSGGILYLRMGNQQTRLTIYYKVNIGGEVSNKNFSLRLNGSSTYFNHAELDHSGHHVADVLANPVSGQSNFYAQCFGLWGAIEFPSVSNLPNKSLINNALLYLPIAYQTNSPYTPSNSITLLYKDASGDYRYVSGSKNIVYPYDGAQKAYVINIRDYIQEIASGKVPNGPIYAVPSPDLFSSSAERIVFNGVSSPYKMRPKLVIKYTEFK